MRVPNAARITIAATLIVVAARFAPAQEPVGLRSGLVSGTREGNVVAYKGIPYAAPPVGDLRWKPPQPPAHWDGVREAITFGLPCAQPPFPPAAFAKVWSEDCLTINVWAPAGAGRSLPVLVAIPGGGFFGGGSSDPRTDGRLLAEQGVVVVSFNYRVGVFGFFAHPALSKESPTGVSGNYGLMDEVFALHWIQDNIAAFGGDPRNVTISGSSAGGSSVLYLMVAPMAKGLFARAIASSSALVYSPLGTLRERWYGREPREAVGLRFGDEIAALRALPAAELLERATTKTDLMFSDDGNDFIPFVDGSVLPNEPWALFEAGKFARVPLIIGTTTDEGTLFASRLSITTADAWRAHLDRRHPGAESQVQAEYAVAADSDVHAAAVRWVNDWYFHGMARATARAVAAHGVPVFLYSFSRVPQGWRFGAFHSAEIDYLFGAPTPPPFASRIRYEAADSALARAIKGAWVQFARTGNPNGPSLPDWPKYEMKTDRHLDLGTEIIAGTGLHARALDAYDRAFAAMRARRATR